jgi:ATP-binding cassette subfamily A (ABC1) protein 3
MWNKISAMTEEKKQCSIILTTHSMPEAENLCGRIGIMVDGRLRCLGPAGALRAKFSQGYMAEFKLRTPEPERVQQCLRLMREGGFLTQTGAEDVSRWLLSTDALAGVCAALGDGSRVAMIHPEGAGWALQAQFASRGHAPALQFAEWWRGETLAALLNAWVLQEFPGSQLLERAGGDFLRFEVHTHGKPLSALFNALEASKERLQVLYYSMSEMSLETVFNAMVSGQDGRVPPCPPPPHTHLFIINSTPSFVFHRPQRASALRPRVGSEA